MMLIPVPPVDKNSIEILFVATGIAHKTVSILTCFLLDQLANMHFRYTSVPRYTPMTD